MHPLDKTASLTFSHSSLAVIVSCREENYPMLRSEKTGVLKGDAGSPGSCHW